jgi:hypothetical protein
MAQTKNVYNNNNKLSARSHRKMENHSCVYILFEEFSPKYRKTKKLVLWQIQLEKPGIKQQTKTQTTKNQRFYIFVHKNNENHKQTRAIINPLCVIKE